jgi:Collagenase
VTVRVTARIGFPLSVSISDSTGNVGTGYSHALVEAAISKVTDKHDIVKAIGSLGGTPYYYNEDALVVEAPDECEGVFIPLAEIKQCRRAAIAELSERISCFHRREGSDGTEAKRNADPFITCSAIGTASDAQTLQRQNEKGGAHVTPTMSVLCRTMEQVQAAISMDFVGESRFASDAWLNHCFSMLFSYSYAVCSFRNIPQMRLR